jgi:hypothetical protein
LLGKYFPRGSPNAAIVLEEFLFSLLLKPCKVSGIAKGLLSREGAHFLGWEKHVGNKRL